MGIGTFRDALTAKSRPLIGAHRGASSIFTENSLEAFRAAIMLGADFLELDVRLSRDGIPVVIHDPTIDRITESSGLVADLTAAELAGQDISPLADILELGREKTFFNIELKPDTCPQALVREVLLQIRSRQLERQVLISSFDHDLLPLVKVEQLATLTGLLYERPLPDAVGYAKFFRADALHPYFRLLTRSLVLQAHASNLFIIPWTVDRALIWRYLVQLGVDGIITNQLASAVNFMKTT